MKQGKKYLNPYTKQFVEQLCNTTDPEVNQRHFRISFLLDRITYVLDSNDFYNKYSKDTYVPDFRVFAGGLQPVGHVEVIFKDDDSDDPLVYGVDIGVRGRQSEILADATDSTRFLYDINRRRSQI